MDRDDAIKMQADLHGDADLLQICLCLRGACNGSSDPWPDKKVAATLSMLQARLDTWNHRPLCLFDAAVYFLVQATLAETKEQ